MKKENYWQSRINAENHNYKLWEDLFLCRQLEDYYEGRQWKQIGITQSNYKPYCLNMIYSAIKIKLANIIYQRPEFNVTAKPGHADWNPEMAYRSAAVKGSALNTVVQNPKVHFVKNIRLAALDSYLRGFGLVEVGYAADWMNPNKTPIVTDVDENPNLNGIKSLQQLKVMYDQAIPVGERFYVNHIKARRFRASCMDTTILDNCEWCGYYCYYRKSVLAKTPGIQLPKQIKNEYYSVGVNERYIKRNVDAATAEDYINSNTYYKTWKLWNNLTKKFELVIETEDWPIIYQKSFDRLPFPHVEWDDRAPSKENIGFYPMPPVFQWISSQDEINQAREQVRNYRKRTVRKFWFNQLVEPDEVQKLSNNVDGEGIKLKGKTTGEQAVGPIDNPQININITEAANLAVADFNVMSAQTANARQQTDRTTATESKILDMRAQARESVEQLDFSQFVSDVGREGLLTIHERFSEGMWVKMITDPSEQFGSEMQDSAPVYNYIQNQDLIDGSYDWDVTIDVQNGTPEQLQQEQQNYFSFMAALLQFPQIALSPILIRETAYKCNYKNERVIREFQKAATMRMMQEQLQAQAQSGGAGLTNNGGQQSQIAQNNPINTIMSNLRQRIGQGTGQ